MAHGDPVTPSPFAQHRNILRVLLRAMRIELFQGERGGSGRSRVRSRKRAVKVFV